MSLSLNHQTSSEFALRYWRMTRAAFDAGDKARYHRNIWWLWNKIQDGDVTNAQARDSYNAAFGTSLNATQWNNLVTTRFIPIKDRYIAWMSETMV